MNKPSDCALYHLLILIQEYIVNNSEIYFLPVEITVDEGRQKAGTKQSVSIISNICNEITYKSSKDECMLQFIDFLAFCLNRIQNNSVKDRSPFDNKFMNIIGKLKWNSNLNTIYVNDIEELHSTFLEENIEKLVNREILGKERVQYIENLAHYLTILKSVLSQNNNKQLDDKTKEVLLNNITEIKNKFYGSEEFKSFLEKFIDGEKTP